MTLKGKLFSCLGVLALATAALGTTAYVVTSEDEAALSTVLVDRVVPLGELKTTADSYAVGIVDAAHKARNGNMSMSDAAAEVRKATGRIDQSWKAYRATKIDGDEEQLASKVEKDQIAADRAVADLQAILDRGDRAALDSFVVGKLYPAIDPVSGSISDLAALQIDVARSETNKALEFAKVGGFIIFLLVLASFATLLVSLFIIARAVVRPLNEITAVMSCLAAGDYKVDISGADRKDEIGAMAKTVAVFRDTGLAAKAAAAEKERADAEQQRVVSEVGSGLGKLAEGDLTAELKDFPAGYVKLQQDFNAAIGELRSAITGIAQSTNNIHGGSGEISQASSDLSRRTEQQAASLEETAAAMTQITTTVQNNAAGAKQAAKLVQEAQGEAKESEKVVGAAVAAMGEIEKSSQEINKIITVIEKIAFQTNLLALNASVEAAHAGEAGQAFAVVANEVRALAQRSADAAQEIAQLISSSTGQVASGVGLVSDAGKALERIIGQVDQIHGRVTQIAAASEQQSTALAEVNTAITEMDKVTQQNAAMVEESTAAARSLADEATGLTTLVERFSTGERARVAPVRKVRSKPSAPAARVRGNTALAVQTEASEDDWNEF